MPRAQGTKTITISLPAPMGREIQRVAAAEGRTVSELLRETFRQSVTPPIPQASPTRTASCTPTRADTGGLWRTVCRMSGLARR